MLLLAFLIWWLLELSVDTTTFVDFFFCRFLSDWTAGDLSQVFSFLTSTILFKNCKNSLRGLLLGELDFWFPFYGSRIDAITECQHWASNFYFCDIVLIMAVFIWFSDLRYLTSSFKDSTILQLIDAFLPETFLQQIFAQGRRISMPLFRNLTAWSDPWNHIQRCYHNRAWGVELLWIYWFVFSGKMDIRWCKSKTALF